MEAALCEGVIGVFKTAVDDSESLSSSVCDVGGLPLPVCDVFCLLFPVLLGVVVLVKVLVALGALFRRVIGTHLCSLSDEL